MGSDAESKVRINKSIGQIFFTIIKVAMWHGMIGVLNVADVVPIISWHISNWASRIYMENKHAVHIVLTSTGCSKKDAIIVTELALDCLKAKATERPNIGEVIFRLANLKSKK